MPAFGVDKTKGETSLSIDLQKPGLWKRIAAGLLDLIMLCVLAVGGAYLISALLDYDGCNDTLQAAYDQYESQYGVTFDIDQQTYEAMTGEQRQNYDAAYEALIADEAAMSAYNMLLNLSLVMTTGGILIAVLILEFVVPLLFGNGQTLGKKAFSLGLIRTDGVKVNAMQLFVRALLGKFTIETMIPVYLILMMFWGIMDMTGTVILCGLGLAQIILYAATRTNAQIHDLLAGTAVVDISSQKIFASSQELIEYTKRIHADRAARQDY